MRWKSCDICLQQWQDLHRMEESVLSPSLKVWKRSQNDSFFHSMVKTDLTWKSFILNSNTNVKGLFLSTSSGLGMNWCTLAHFHWESKLNCIDLWLYSSLEEFLQYILERNLRHGEFKFSIITSIYPSVWYSVWPYGYIFKNQDVFW